MKSNNPTIQKLTPQSITNAIMKFTSLDQETVSSQLLPYLNSLKTKSQIEEYLKSLLGSGLEQDSFIKQIILNKFKSEQIKLIQNQNQNQLDFPNLNTKPKLNSEISHSSNSIKITKSKAIPNQSIQTHSKQNINQDWSSKFGSGGNVYVKDKRNDQNQSKGFKKPVNEKELFNKLDQSTSNSRIPSPIPEPVKLEEIITISENASDLKPKRLTSVSELTIPLSESILRELYQLERIITSLQTEGSDLLPNQKSKTRACFCLGRIHDLPSSPLPNLCSYCGMIYCKLKLPFSPCPSCLKLDKIFHKSSNFKDSILSHFELKREELIDIEVTKFERLQEKSRLLALSEEKLTRDFPNLSSKSNDQIQDDRNSYVDQVNGFSSIEDRIREGYQKLQNVEEIHHSSNSRTVLRLDSKSGKTKLVTTTKTIKNQKKSKTQVQEENLTKIKEIENEFISLKSLDDLDDGYRLSVGLEPLLSVPFGNVKSRVVKVIEYVPVMSYQNDA